MTYVCAAKSVADEIPYDIIFAVTAGNSDALQADIRLVGRIDHDLHKLPEQEREMLTQCLVVAADHFRAKLTELIHQRRNPPVVPGITT